MTPGTVAWTGVAHVGIGLAMSFDATAFVIASTTTNWTGGIDESDRVGNLPATAGESTTALITPRQA